MNKCFYVTCIIDLFSFFFNFISSVRFFLLSVVFVYVCICVTHWKLKWVSLNMIMITMVRYMYNAAVPGYDDRPNTECQKSRHKTPNTNLLNLILKHLIIHAFSFANQIEIFHMTMVWMCACVCVISTIPWHLTAYVINDIPT